MVLNLTKQVTITEYISSKTINRYSPITKKVQEKIELKVIGF